LVDLSDESDDDSSANEYAEGLGCADRKACRKRAASTFEFDIHPREEYFEQPRSYRQHDLCDSSDWLCEVQPEAKRICTRKSQDSSRVSFYGMLTILEEQEQLEKGMARSRHDCKHQEEQIMQEVPLTDRFCDGAVAMHSNHESSSAPRRASHVDNNVRSVGSGAAATSAASSDTVHCFKEQTQRRVQEEFSGLRKVDRADEATRSSQLLSAELQRLRFFASTGVHVGGRTVMALLKQLEHLELDICLLQSSGVGKELNLQFWQNHSCSEIRCVCMTLVKKWRLALRNERRILRLCKGGG